MKGDSFYSSEKFGSLGRDDVGIPRSDKAKDSHQGEDNKSTCHKLNIIIRGFAGDRKISAARKRYARQILSVKNLLEVML